MLKILRCLVIAACLLGIVINSNVAWAETLQKNCRPNQYYKKNLKRLKGPGLNFMKIPAFQQSNDWNCGPAVLLTIANYYFGENFPMTAEMETRIAREAGTRDLSHEFPGTRPEEMLQWLNNNGFEATLSFEEVGDGTALFELIDHIQNDVPVIVEWSDWGGHWVIAVGYDNRNTENLLDDVVIFADPYDHHDDVEDGYSYFNAVRFYNMWFDALFFGELTWRTMIVPTPRVDGN